MGGEYLTGFRDDERSEFRKRLYVLENHGLVKLERKKLKEKGFYEFKWVLSKKGKEFLKNKKELKKLWDSQDLIQFYNQMKKNLKFEDTFTTP